MQHGVCRIDLCCLVYFSAIVKNQSLKKKKSVLWFYMLHDFVVTDSFVFWSSVLSNTITLLAYSQENSAPQGWAIKIAPQSKSI